MWSRRHRTALLALFGATVLAGVGLEAALDPIEESHPGLTVLLLLLALVLLGVAGSYWFGRRIDAIDGPDERVRAIELRASRRSQATLAVGVAVLATVLLLPWIEAPVAVLLWALLASSVLVHEGSIEYYRRAM